MQNSTLRLTRPAKWLALAALACLASCGGGDNNVNPGAGNGNGNNNEARSDWDDLVWDEDDWS